MALSACLPPAATASNPTDYSDLWWNPAESGWGIGLQRQGDVIFATLFVYGADGAATWLVAPDVRLQSADGAASSWRGTLYRTRGPGFAAPFDAIESAAVGTATLDFADAEAGVLRYTVDGTPVTRQITRMTWREPSAAGSYHGGFSANVGQCADVGRIGIYDFLGALTVTQQGNTLTARIVSTRAGLPSNCTFNAAARTTGRLQYWEGAFSCSIVTGFDDRSENIQRVTRTGPFRIDRIAANAHGFHGELTAADQDCAFAGHFGGTRRP